MASNALHNMPQHVAIVMDGNGRWAAKRFLPRLAGHQQGVVALRRCVKACVERSVGVLTVFAFSSENWNRPAEEVSSLMELLVQAVVNEVPDLQKNGVRLYFVGDRQRLSAKVQAALSSAELSTASQSRMVLNVCFNYGGRWDMAQQKVAASGQPITELAIDRALALAHVPDPDLLIRTGGELRISNFLLWQAAYTELHFTDKLWPEFDETALDEALHVYRSRERRFGQSSAQIQAAEVKPSDQSVKAA